MARITVEDCLKTENNRFALVLLASQRAKQLLSGSDALIDTRGNKAIVSALREIAASKVRFMTPEEAQREAEEERRRAEEEREELLSTNSATLITPSQPMMSNGDGSSDESSEGVAE